jgi:hypothetical protein
MLQSCHTECQTQCQAPTVRVVEDAIGARCRSWIYGPRLEPGSCVTIASMNAPSRLVFVSHSGIDTWVAKQLAREITHCGATAFLDEAEIDVGASFEDDILEFLSRADELVVLLTPWALDRPYVWAELGAAWGRRIPIVGLLLGLTPSELQQKSETPILLKERNLIPLNEIDKYLAQLRERAAPDGASEGSP